VGVGDKHGKAGQASRAGTLLVSNQFSCGPGSAPTPPGPYSSSTRTPTTRTRRRSGTGEGSHYSRRCSWRECPCRDEIGRGRLPRSFLPGAVETVLQSSVFVAERPCLGWKLSQQHHQSQQHLFPSQSDLGNHLLGALHCRCEHASPVLIQFVPLAPSGGHLPVGVGQKGGQRGRAGIRRPGSRRGIGGGVDWIR
jgi:hypothetical protein